MKKLFVYAVLAIFALGFGSVARAEEARSNSPLSKVEPAMEATPSATPDMKTVIPSVASADLAPQEEAKSETDALDPAKEASDDLAAPAPEDEAPKSDSEE